MSTPQMSSPPPSPPRAVRVRVPASSANLGPGFDALGLALARYDEVWVGVADDGLSVEVTGEGAESVPRDQRHLVVRALHAGFEVFGGRPAGLRLRCSNRIPHARGLGSSAAATVAGAAAAAALAGHDPAAEWKALLQVTAHMEGHPDNVAASLLGGLVIAWKHSAGGAGTDSGNNRGRFDAVRLDVNSNVRPVLLIATRKSSTKTTRGLLPIRVPFADAVFNASRTALAVHAFTREPGLLLDATEDRLHQGYRRPAYPESAELVERLREHRIPAVISGAGPSVLALPADGSVPSELVGDGFTICPTPVDQMGVHVEAR